MPVRRSGICTSSSLADSGRDCSCSARKRGQVKSRPCCNHHPPSQLTTLVFLITYHHLFGRWTPTPEPLSSEQKTNAQTYSHHNRHHHGILVNNEYFLALRRKRSPASVWSETRAIPRRKCPRRFKRAAVNAEIATGCSRVSKLWHGNKKKNAWTSVPLNG